MVDLLGRDDIDALLRRHGLGPSRSLGQNFVADPWTVERIALAAEVGPGDAVVEVGPGLGSLTLALAATGAEVLALEKDDSLTPVLVDVLAARAVDNVRVVAGDAVGAPWSDLLGTQRRWAMVANLPYNVAVPIIVDVLRNAEAVDRLVVMVQKEVAERIVATPGGRTIGVPTMKIGWYANAELLFEVPPEVFVPRPKVTSAVIRLTRRPPPATDLSPREVFGLIGTAYGQRRKMLRSSLGGSVPAEFFAAAGLDPRARPETLDLDDWCRLARAVRDGDARPPGEPVTHPHEP